jgi:hypothetical protein
MKATFKYVHLYGYGFILWPYSDDLWHSQIGHLAACNLGRNYPLVSAGFARVVPKTGKFLCWGQSESLKLRSLPDDTEKMNAQFFGEKE